MVCLSGTSAISAEARELIATRPYHREGMRQLAVLLPADDAELNGWLSGAYATHDEDSFTQLWAAAGMGNRRLSASLIPAAIMMRIADSHIGWLAWRMEGDVAGEFLRALDSIPQGSERCAMFLFVAAVWWREHRAAEEMPRQILSFATAVSRQKDLTARAVIYLQNLATLVAAPDLVAQCGTSRSAQLMRRQLDRMMALLNGPFDVLLYERATRNYESSAPQRRAVERIGRNEKCPCASGQKYKHCCAAKDRQRLSYSSSVAGMTHRELTDQDTPLTEEALKLLGPAGLARLDPSRVPVELQAQYIFMLSVMKMQDEAIAALQTLGVGEHLYDVWGSMFSHAADTWRPDIARRLVELFPDADEKLGEGPNAGVKLLLVGDDPATFLETVEKELRSILESRDLVQLYRLIAYLLASPYRSLGIHVARGLLPIAQDDDHVTDLFQRILDARGSLNLSPDDEFGDFMDRRALKNARNHDSAELDEVTKKLAESKEEERRAKEERARLEREVKLLRQKKRREETASAVPMPLRNDDDAEGKIRDLKLKIDRLSAVVAEGANERLVLRQTTEKLTRENEAMRSATSSRGAQSARDDEGGKDELVSFEGNQPVRLIDFPKDFAERLAELPQHAARAVMKRIGLIAAGDDAGFAKIKQLKAYPGVLRARVSDKFRLFLTLTPDRVRIVDVIWRDDLDKWVKQLLARGYRCSVG